MIRACNYKHGLSPAHAGEPRTTLPASPAIQGLSPPTRGSPSVSLRLAANTAYKRSIPAHAGEPS